MPSKLSYTEGFRSTAGHSNQVFVLPCGHNFNFFTAPPLELWPQQMPKKKQRTVYCGISSEVHSECGISAFKDEDELQKRLEYHVGTS